MSALGNTAFVGYPVVEALYGHTGLQFAIVTADPDVREFQVVQQGDSLLLRVALRDGAAGAPERLGSRLGARLSELGVPEPSVRVERVDALERTPGGKLKLVVASP